MSGPSLPRSYLYVPGNAPDKLAKAHTRGADALILDLEDAVPFAGKDAARAAVVAWLGEQSGSTPGELWVRVNSGALRMTDVDALAGVAALSGLILAKIEDADEVAAVAQRLADAGDVTTKLMPLIETASALLEARSLASQERVRLLQVGEIDLAGELALDVGPDEVELAGVRTMVVVASAAAGLESPVGPVSRITADLDAFAVSTERVKRQGFMGRACIHPAQVEVVHRVFTPTAHEVEEARSVIALVEQAERAGSGVILDQSGRLVDAAVLHSAHRTLALAARSSTP